MGAQILRKSRVGVAQVLRKNRLCAGVSMYKTGLLDFGTVAA